MRFWHKLQTQKDLNRNLVAIIIFVAVYFFCVYTIGHPCINLDKSLTGKLYWAIPYHGIRQGDIVVFKFRGSRYFPRGAMFIKKVACLPGQKLIEENRCFTCDGKPIGCAKKTDKLGNPAPLFKYRGIIPPGKYFVVGTSKNSYDSKYWGFVDIGDIKEKAYRLF